MSINETTVDNIVSLVEGDVSLTGLIKESIADLFGRTFMVMVYARVAALAACHLDRKSNTSKVDAASVLLAASIIAERYEPAWIRRQARLMRKSKPQRRKDNSQSSTSTTSTSLVADPPRG